MKEIWKPIAGFEGLYEASNTGKIRSLDRTLETPSKYGFYYRTYKGKILAQCFDGKKNYLHVNLCKNGKSSIKLVHRIIAETFIPNPKNLPEINHKDEDKTNNLITNLEWCNHKYNNNYGSKANASKGENNSQNKFSQDIILKIRKEYIHRDKQFGVTALSKKYGISIPHICAIVKRKRWGWLE